MRRSFAFAVAACSLLFAATAHAGWPSPANSTIPGHVNLVGLGPAGPDSAFGHCEVIFRDLANNPMPGVEIALDFSDVSDMTIATDPHDPRLTVHCSPRMVTAVTDQNGRAVFTVIGSAIPGRPASPVYAFKLYADGILLGSPTLSAFDMNGQGGVDPTDLSLWSADFFSVTNPMRADYDGTGGVSIADLSLWSGAYFGAGSVQSAASYCP